MCIIKNSQIVSAIRIFHTQLESNILFAWAKDVQTLQTEDISFQTGNKVTHVQNRNIFGSLIQDHKECWTIYWRLLAGKTKGFVEFKNWKLSFSDFYCLWKNKICSFKSALPSLCLFLLLFCAAFHFFLFCVWLLKGLRWGGKISFPTWFWLCGLFHRTYQMYFWWESVWVELQVDLMWKGWICKIPTCPVVNMGKGFGCCGLISFFTSRTKVMLFVLFFFIIFCRKYLFTSPNN